MNLSLLGAYLGGVLTLLSPCSVMVLPAFFAYAFSSPSALLSRTAVFFAGLATALVPLGMLAGTLGAWVNKYRFELVSIAAVVVIVFGIVLLLGVPLPGLIKQQSVESASVASVFALGTVYGLAGVCAGPLLGAALSFAAFGGNGLYGGLVLMVFALGMVTPLILLALLWNKVPVVRRLVRPREMVIGRWRNAWTNIIGGALTIAIGVLLLVTSGTTSIGGIVGATTQAQIESSVMSATSQVPDWIVVLIFAALVALWLFTAVRTTSKRSARKSVDTRARGENEPR